jgi:hypothetical protein
MIQITNKNVYLWDNSESEAKSAIVKETFDRTKKLLPCTVQMKGKVLLSKDFCDCMDLKDTLELKLFYLIASSIECTCKIIERVVRRDFKFYRKGEGQFKFVNGDLTFKLNKNEYKLSLNKLENNESTNISNNIVHDFSFNNKICNKTYSEVYEYEFDAIVKEI